MQSAPLTLGVQSNPGRDVAAGVARLINCRMEDAGPEGKAQYPLYAIDGFTQFATSAASGTGAMRAILAASSSFAYAVSGTKVLKIGTAGGTATVISGKSQTATITVASPGVVTMAAHGLREGAAIVFSTTGALPTGITAGTTYYVRSTSLATNTFTISAAAGINGTAVNTSGTQSGTHTVATASTVSASGLVTMDINRKATQQIGIATSDGHYYVVENDVLVEYSGTIAELASGTLQSLVFVNGYFVLTFDNGEFFYTGLDEARTIDPLKVAEANYAPDNLVRPFRRGNGLVLFGERSTEFYDDTGAADFTFERQTGANFGLWAPGSAAQIPASGGEGRDTIAFIQAESNGGGYAGVCLLNGYGTTPISDPFVDRTIQAGSRSTIRAYVRKEQDVWFYVVTDLVNYTLAYNLKKGLWHEEKSSGLNFRRISCATSFGDYMLLGDYALAKVYSSQSSLYNAAADSVVTLRHSNDNGTTWRAERSKTIGQSTASMQRFKWLRLGQSREDGKVFQIEITNALMEDGTGVSMFVQPPAVHAYPNPVRFFKVFLDVVQASSRNSKPKGVLGGKVDFQVLRG